MRARRVDKEGRQGYKGLGFRHIQHVYLANEADQKVRDLDRIIPIEGVILHSYGKILEVHKHFSGFQR